MTTYTVLDRDGSVIARNLTAVDAMREILTYDSNDYEIRTAEDGGGWKLGPSQFSRASTLGGEPMVKSMVFSLDSDESAATDEIARRVIAAGWPRRPTAMSDESYDAVLKEIENSSND